MALKPTAPKCKINVPWVKQEPPAAPSGTPLQLRQFNPSVYRGGMGVNFSFPLPEKSKGPIRAKETRRNKGRAGF